jgi:hypothetical protein
MAVGAGGAGGRRGEGTMVQAKNERAMVVGRGRRVVGRCWCGQPSSRTCVHVDGDGAPCGRSLCDRHVHPARDICPVHADPIVIPPRNAPTGRSPCAPRVHLKLQLDLF